MKTVMRWLVCLAAVFSAAAIAGPGQLDPSFANGGVLTLDFSYSKDFDARVAIRSDLNVLVAGTVPATDGSGPETVLTRVDRTGQLDTGFGYRGWYLLRNIYPSCIPVSMAEVPIYQDIIVVCRTADRLVLLSTRYNGYLAEDSVAPVDAVIAVRADGMFYIAGNLVSGGQSSLVVSRYAANGYLDYSFGSSGRVYIPSAPTETLRLRAAMVDAAGALLVAGSSTDTARFTGSDLAVLRIRDDGTLDPAFGQGGKAIADQAGLDDYASAIAVDSQGRIVVGGRAGDAVLGGRFILWRLTAGGADDTTFNGTGRVTLTLSPSVAYDSELTSLVLETTGSITAVGPARRLSDGGVDFAVARVMPNGAPDPYFGTCESGCGATVGPSVPEADSPLAIAVFNNSTFVIAGRRGGDPGTQVVTSLYDWNSGYPYYYADPNAYRLFIAPPAGVDDVAVQADSRILVLGSINETARVRRFFANGTPDPGFGENGEALLDANFENPTMLVQPDGKIVVGGGGFYFPQARRLLPDGTLDPSFGQREIVTGYTVSLAVQADGKIVAALTRFVPHSGSYSDEVVVARLNADGTHDTSFGTGGEILIEFRAGVDSHRASQVYARPEGIYVVGHTRFLPWDPWNFRLTVWRLLPSGALDPSWGDNGIAYATGRDNVAFGGTLAFVGGQVVAGGDCGRDTIHSCFARFNADGALDASFGNAGVLEYTIDTSGDGAIAMDVDSHGLLVVAGRTAAFGYALRMYTNGQLDTTFNGTGVNSDVTTTGFPSTGALQPNGALVMGASTVGAWIISRVEGAGWDSTAPDTTITSGPSSTVSQSSASFTFIATEPATFQCRLDGAAYAACTSPATYSGLAEGTHTFEVRATDLAGNVDATPATRTWTVDTIAPDTLLAFNPATSPTNSSSFTATFGSEVGATFECRLDGVAYAPCTSPVTQSGLADGSHTFDVRAKDAAGNVDPTPASRTWTVDTVAPDTTITSGPSGAVSSTSAIFAFSSNESGTTFECRLDGAAFAACTSPANLSGLGEGSHTFDVRARDGAGNIDATPASRTWTVDTVAPDTTITSGPSGSVSSTSATFAFSSNESGATFECRLDGVTFAACTTPVNLSGLAQGSHTFDVRAKDAAGNIDATPASRTWTVDTIVPDTTITSGPTGAVSSTSATFAFTATETATFQCSLDGAAFASCTSPVGYSSLAQGSHTFQVRATDTAGNTDATPASRTWTVDTIAPDTTITSGPSGSLASNSATFAFTSNEAGVTFECRLDGGAFTACTSPVNLTGLSEGAHTFDVRATDAAGNIDATPASRTWTVDTVPETTIVSGPSGAVASTSATFTFSSDDPAATFECHLDGAAFAACATPKTYSGLTQGSHTFYVRAKDATGHTDATPASGTWTVDTVAPNTSINSKPGNNTSPPATFAFSSNESGATFECRLDGAAFAVCTSPTTYASLSSGNHTFDVRAKDAAGNVDPAPATYTWKVK